MQKTRLNEGRGVLTSRGGHTGIKKRRPKATAGRLHYLELQYLLHHSAHSACRHCRSRLFFRNVGKYAFGGQEHARHGSCVF